MSARYCGVLRDVLPAGLQQREELHASVQLGVLGEQQVVGREAAHDVLAGIGAVDAQHQLAAGEPLVEVGQVLVGAVGGRLRLERGHVDADRVGAHVHRPAAGRDRHGRQVDRQVEQLLRAQDERPGVGPGVERDDVAAEQTEQQSLAHVGRQDLPGLGTGPRDVHEVADHGVGAALPDQPSDEVEVVVVQEHDGLAAAALDLLDDGVGRQLVGDGVAVLEGRALVASDRRAGLEVVQAVLDEPQQGVGDHAVERLVHLGGHVDEAHRHLALAALALLEDARLAVEGQAQGGVAGLGRHLAVGGAPRDADPHGLLEVPGQP